MAKVGEDCKDTIVTNISNVEENSRIKNIINQSWQAFQKFGFWFTLAILIGVYSGVTATKVYYKEKMQESIDVGGLSFNKKVYSIILK